MAAFIAMLLKVINNTAKFNRSKHDKDSPMLIGEVDKDAVIKEREMKSLRTDQLSMFY